MIIPITNATPRYILNGVNDKSIPEALPVEQTVPTHFPHFLIFAERGDANPVSGVGTALTDKFGANSFSYRSAFANHATAFVNTLTATGNQVICQRLIPADAKTAFVRLALEVADGALVPKYARLANGQYQLDANGEYIPVLDVNDDPVMIPGVVYIWHLNPASMASFGHGAATSITLTYPRGGGVGSVPSTIYPIIDAPVNSAGAFGNLVGLRATAPTGSGTDVTVAQAMKQFIYRFQLVERPRANATPNAKMDNDGGTYSDVVLANNVYHPQFNSLMSASPAFINRYKGVKQPLREIYIYNDNVDEVNGILFDSEAAALVASIDSWVPIDYTDETLKGLMNILTGVDFNGVPYESIRRGTVNEPDVFVFDTSGMSVAYASGGNDGDISLQNFDLLARNFFDQYENHTAWRFMDDAKWQQSCVYDSGFSFETKNSIASLLGLRKDMAVVLSTHASCRFLTVGPTTVFEKITNQLSVAEESSMTIALRTMMEAYPESETFGTSCFRGMVVQQSGHLINSEYHDFLPLTIDIMYRNGLFMGSGDGRWKGNQAPDSPEGKVVAILTDLNETWRPFEVYQKDWANGAIYASSYDLNRYYTPAQQTVYPFDVSVLNSAITMWGCVELEKIAQKSFRYNCGNSDLTADQMAERSDEYIQGQIDGKFAGRFRISAKTYYTLADANRNYSWSTDINIGAKGMYTVGSYTINAYRYEDFPTE